MKIRPLQNQGAIFIVQLNSSFQYGSNGLEYGYINNENYGHLTYNIQYFKNKKSKFVVKKLLKNSKHINIAKIFIFDEKYNLIEVKRDNGYNSKWTLEYKEE